MKAQIKKFFDNAHDMVERMLPPELVHILREKLADFTAMMLGEYASASEIFNYRT